MASAAEQEQQKNKQVVRQYVEIVNRHDIERTGQLVISSYNYSFHFPGAPAMDWNATKQFFTAFISAFPDISHKIEDMVAEGDKVAIRVSITGTHKGEFQGIPPTGKEVSFSVMNFLTIIDGKIVEQWVNVDMMGLMQQIGAIPADAHASSSAAARS